MSSKEASSTIFDITRSRIEPRSAGPLVNILTIMLMSGLKQIVKYENNKTNNKVFHYSSSTGSLIFDAQKRRLFGPFGWAVWHSCRMGDRNQEQTRGRIGPQLRLGNLRVGELLFRSLCTPCIALDLTV